MRPSTRLLRIMLVMVIAALLLALARLSVTAEWLQYVSHIWWIILGGLGVALVIDAWWWRERQPLQVARDLPGSFAVGVHNDVVIRVENCTRRQLDLIVTDHYPPQITVAGLPALLTLGREQHSEVRYTAKPVSRGDALFSGIDVRMNSALGLLQFRHFFPLPQTVSVYPNFTSIGQFERLGHDQQVSQMGIHITQRRGQGMDFHQLREYREGDTTRQIDWKASSRYRKLISREYQDERDQDIIFLLDCGRRMRTKDGELSHFDHSLNSLLLLSYVALRQGDAVGFLSFAGVQRWLSPVKGQANINVLLNSVYDLHSSPTTSDLVEAAKELMLRHRKRALVILISNLREEDSDDVIAATRLLNKRHLVLVASLREALLNDVVESPVTDFESSLTYAETVNILGMRRRLLETLRAEGVVITDSLPQKLHIQLVNEYWALKRSGRI